MTKAEIMNCAAILAAGLIAQRHPISVDDDYAVDLMMDIAEKLQSKLGSEEEIEYPQI